MAYRSKRGLGVTTYECEAIQNSMDPMSAHVSLPCMWAAIFGYSNSEIGTPPAPTGSALTVAPASGTDAQALADQLANQQAAAQQAVNAGAVQSTIWEQSASAAVDMGNAASNVLTSALPWVLGGVVVFALVAIGGGSPGRYGR